MYRQYDSTAIVTFFASEYLCPLVSTDLNCLLTEARVCERLAWDHTRPCSEWEGEIWTQDLLIASPAL